MPLYSPPIEPLFDRIATHLATQYGQSVAYLHNTTGCAYRGAHGTSCAVGCLISEAQMQRYVEEATAADELCPDLLDELHDQYAPESCGPEFVHVLLCAQRYHDGGWNHLTPSYSDRLEQFPKDDPGLHPQILEDLKARYCKTPIGG